MGRINVTSPIFAEPTGSNIDSTAKSNLRRCEHGPVANQLIQISSLYSLCVATESKIKLTWLVLGGDPVARSHRVEQFTAL